MNRAHRSVDPAPDEDLCVARVPLFRGLSAEEQRDVASVARPTRVTKGERIYAAGADVSQLLVVHTGSVKIARSSPEGSEQIVRVLGPGDFVGESAFVSGSRPDHDAVALEAGNMCVFRHADVGRLVAQHPSIGLRMLEGVSRRLEATEARLAALVSSDVSARLAGYLLSLPARHHRGDVLVQLPMAKKDVASLLDTTPESFSRQLRRLQDSGIIAPHDDATIQLVDIDALMGLSTPT